MKKRTLDDYLKEKLKSPTFAKEWKNSEVQYQITRQLIKARVQKNWSQRQLAKAAETTQAVISRIESLSVNPSIGLLDKISRALGKRLEVKLAG
jgi:ribosome-binding protein aMBF1 (putative translation factor)